MRHFIVSPFLIIALMMGFTAPIFSQDQKITLEIGNNLMLNHLLPDGKTGFFAVCDRETITRSIVGQWVMKYDENLQPVWKEPAQFSIAMGFGEVKDDVQMLTFMPENASKTIDYLIDGNNIYQVAAQGVPQKLKIKIPKKEMRELAAAFTTEKGLNVLTIVGDEVFPTGELNWYTIDHNDLAMTQRKIKLPLPTGTDEDNESGWRLNAVTSTGLYFYYVSYKNSVKDDSRSILDCHLVKVDFSGNAGNIVKLATGLEAYTVLPAFYQQYHYSGMVAKAPQLIKHEIRNKSSIMTPNDNAHLGVYMDENEGRAYLVMANNPDLGVSKKGIPVAENIIGTKYPSVRSLTGMAFDLQGKKLGQSTVKIAPHKLAATDNYSNDYVLEIAPLGSKEGFSCKFTSNGKGVLAAFDTNGKLIEEHTVKAHPYFQMTARKYNDAFDTRYFSLAELRKSPYANNEKTKLEQYFQKLNDDDKKNAQSVSTLNQTIIAVTSRKENTINFASFSKNNK